MRVLKYTQIHVRSMQEIQIRLQTLTSRARRFPDVLLYSLMVCSKLRPVLYNISSVWCGPEEPFFSRQILCIHLKRFRHEVTYSFKISSHVSFPLEGLDLQPFLAKDSPTQITTYDLLSVICHHGTAGSEFHLTWDLNVSFNTRTMTSFACFWTGVSFSLKDLLASFLRWSLHRLLSERH